MSALISRCATARVRAAAMMGLLLLIGAAAPAVTLPMVTSTQQRADPEVGRQRTLLRTTGALITPVMADAFADSFGINTRFGQSIYSRPLVAVEGFLGELGFRHIRDGNVSYNRETRAVLQSLCTRYGIHSGLGLDDTDSDQAILQYKKDVPCVDFVEGPNELNGQPNWVQRLATFVPHAYKLIRGTPEFNGIPFVGPSITKLEDGQALGDAIDLSSYVDFGNKHSYPGQRNIGGVDGTGAHGFGSKHDACPQYAYGSYFYSICIAQLFTKSRPIWTTETGYSSTPSGLADQSKHPPYGSIPDDVAAKYLPRVLAYEFANGVSRTYIFALLDGSSGCDGPFNALGIIAQDCPNTGLPSSLHPKPAFYALKSLMSVVSDPGLAFTPQPITLKIDGGDAKLQTLLLQKRDRQYMLLYWVEGSDWNVSAGTYETVAPQRVALSVAGAGTQDGALEFGIDKTGSLTRPQAVRFASGTAQLTATDEIHFLTFYLTGQK